MATIETARWRIVILVGSLAAFGFADFAWAVNAWERWQVELTAAVARTPLQAYHDTQLEATFWRKVGAVCSEPSASACTNPTNCFKGLGFWDGDGANPGRFMIRSAFPAGTWCWKTCLLPRSGSTCATDAGLNRSGEVVVTAPPAPASRLYANGFPKAPAGKRNLTYWNGQTPFQWLGDTAWNAPIRYASDRTTWSNYVKKRAVSYVGNTFAGGDGFTNVLVAPAFQTFGQPPAGGFRGFVPPAGCATDPRPVVPASCHYWDSAYWRDFEELVKVANDAGLVVVVVNVIDPLTRAGTNQGISPAVLFPARADAAAFARNLAGRLAGSFVMYSPSFDAKVADDTAEAGVKVAGLIDAVGAALRAAAPRHLIGVHLAGGSPLSDYDQFQSKPWLSLHVFQSGHGGGTCDVANVANAYAKFACRAHRLALRFRCIGEPQSNGCTDSGAPTSPLNLPKKPAVNIEGQYETPGDEETRVQTRHTGWNSGLSGSFGFNIGVWPDIAAWTSPSTYAAASHRSDEDLGRMKGLFKSMPWSNLVPRWDILVEQNNFSQTTCGNMTKADRLQLWKPYLAIDAASGYGLAYLPRPSTCTLPNGNIIFKPSTSIVLDRAKANSLGISCAKWKGVWISPGSIDPSGNGYRDSVADCVDSGAGPIHFKERQTPIPCGGACDRVLRLTKSTSGVGNSPNLSFASSIDLEPSVELSDDGLSSRVTGQVVVNELPAGDPLVLSGPDFLFRSLPSAALDAEGNFLVAWQEENGDGTNDVVAARLNSGMESLGPPFQINDTLEGDQAEPWVSSDDTGDTVVVWTAYNEDDEIAGDIYGKILGSSGQPTGSEFLVSSEVLGNQFLPQVQMDGNGGFVVAWTEEPPGDALDIVPIPPGEEESAISIEAPAEGMRRGREGGVYYRVFAANGRPRGLERRVAETSSGRARLSRLEVHRHGGFKIRWRAFDSEGQDQGEREEECDRDGNPNGGR